MVVSAVSLVSKPRFVWQKVGSAEKALVKSEAKSSDYDTAEIV